MQYTHLILLVSLVFLLGCSGQDDTTTERAITEAEVEAARQAEIARLTELYRGRLPQALGPYQIAMRDRGVEGGVGHIDFELQTDALGLPPLIIAAGGSEGGFWLGSPSYFPNQIYMGRALHAYGFSIRSVGYFGDSELPDFMGEAQLDTRLIERPLEPIAAKVFSARTTHDASRRCTGFLGVSKGGELTMLLAAYADALVDGDGPLFDAAVAVVPSHVVWQAPYVTMRRRSGWSLDGEPLAFVPYPWLSPHLASAFIDYPHVGALGEQALRNESAVDAARIPVERINIPLLMQGGIHDDVWPSSPMADAELARASSLNPDHRLEVVHYDLDHFLTAEAEPVLDAVAFLYEQLREAAEAGRCQADFLPLGTTEPSQTP